MPAALSIWLAGCASAGAAGGTPTVSLHLVLRFHSSGGIELVTASEVEGRSVVARAMHGDFVVEVRSGDRTLSIQGVPDPFEVRGSGNPDVPEHEGRAATAMLTIRVPGLGLASPELDTLEVHLLRARAGGEALGALTPELLAELRREGKLETVASAAPGALASAIRERGTRAKP